MVLHIKIDDIKYILSLFFPFIKQRFEKKLGINNWISPDVVKYEL